MPNNRDKSIMSKIHIWPISALQFYAKQIFWGWFKFSWGLCSLMKALSPIHKSLLMTLAIKQKDLEDCLHP